MLSICIPVYNNNVQRLVSDLNDQVKKASIPCEILVMDDFSDPGKIIGNNNIVQYEHVRYIQLDQNLGRARIRNLLSKEARYPTLLFLDGDMEIISDKFLEYYLGYILQEQVTIGGIAYQKERPDASFILHWSFGTKREQKSAGKRNKYPSRSMMTGNFMVAKAILEKNPFWENLTAYGHEDTLWGIQLCIADMPIVHINNPALHGGLQRYEDFIRKQEEACINLVRILKTYPHLDLLYRQVTLLKAFQALSRLRLTGITKKTFKLIRPWLLKKLKSDHPGLFFLDVYKLGFFTGNYPEDLAP